ncbi:hypothetical protein BDV97DRAFT_275033, partial [Delphinella strobiligena]
MGGSAFARPGPKGEPALKTPRMSRDIYEPLKKLCFDVISDHYSTVVCLRDAPEKHDFGDIDFLVQDPMTYDANEQIAKKLNAERTVTNSLDFTLAIPRPQHEGQGNNLPIYAQLDIRVYPPLLSLPWLSYLHSHGDLGQILGHLSYDLGLTSNDKGFYLRIAEQEKTNWSASMIFLSRDPVAVMKFLGLNTCEYAAGFETEEQLFRWHQSASGEAMGASKLQNSEHKRRMTTRPLFARFIKSYLPNLPLMPTDVSIARKKLLQAALAYFNKEEEYLSRLATALENINDETARVLIVAHLTSTTGLATKYANEIVRGIRHWV